MAKKAILSALAGLLFFLAILSEIKKDNLFLDILTYVLTYVGPIILLIYVAFELLVKNNVYLFAGMEFEMDYETSRKPEVQKKYRKLAIIVGLLLFAIAIHISFLLCFHLKELYLI